MSASQKNILVVNLNPTFQRTIRLANLEKGEVNRAFSMRFDISGKGVNVARVLQQLGSQVRYLTHLGGGRETFLKLNQKEQLNILWQASGSVIRTCITLLDDAEMQTTEVIEPTTSVDEATVQGIRRLFRQEILVADWLILTGSCAPGYPANLFLDFCKLAAREGVAVAADFRGPELLDSLAQGIAVVKINLVEFVQTFLPELKASEANDEEALPLVEEKMRQLSRAGCDYVVTRGGRQVLYSHAGQLHNINPPQLQSLNSIGCGDAFTAGLVKKLADGSGLAEAVKEGIRCGSLNATFLKPGSIIPD